MRILILCHSFNSLTQRLHVELRERGHEVSVEFDINDAVTREAVDLFRPDVLLAPFLKRAIPEDVWRALPCLIVHPGPRGDRGPSALDWALLEGEELWGVTIIYANGEMDGGSVLAWREFPMREATKSSLYRNEATEAAVAAVLEALTGIEGGAAVADVAGALPGRARPYCSAQARQVDFARDGVKSALAKIRSADGEPGAAARLFGREMRVFDAHPANLSGAPGEIVARSGPALGVALGDGAIWIGHVRAPEPLNVKLPATLFFAAECESLVEREGYPGVRYEERGMVGLLEFPFYNGAMGTQACAELKAAVAAAAKRPIRVLVLTGGPDYWSNGLDLARIEASRSPAEESWANINAMNDLCGRSCSSATNGSSPLCEATPGRAASSWRWRPTKSGCASASSSIRTTRTWATCMGRNIGPICYLAASTGKIANDSRARGCPWGSARRSGSAS